MGTLRALADTSLFVGLEQGRIDRSDIPRRVAVSMITIGELRFGLLAAQDAATRTMRLRSLEGALAFGPLPVDQRVADTWADLRVALRSAGRRLEINDSWIAATAITHGLPIVTQDRDFEDVPGLHVVTL